MISGGLSDSNSGLTLQLYGVPSKVRQDFLHLLRVVGDLLILGRDDSSK